MRKKRIAMLIVLCLLCSFTACSGDPPTTDSSGITTNSTSTTAPAPLVHSTTFDAMPQKTQNLAYVYCLSDTVVLFSFVTPGMDASCTELVSYDLSGDQLLGELDLGEGWVEIFPQEDGFALFDHNCNSYTVYDSACQQISTVALRFDGTVGMAAQNGDRLIISDMRTGRYYIYDLSDHTVTPVDETVGGADFTWAGNQKDAFLLHSYADGVLAVAADGKCEPLNTVVASAQAIGGAYAAGVLGDYAVFYSLVGGDSVMSPVRGDAESFCDAMGNGYLSRSNGNTNALHYYDLNRRTVTDVPMDGVVIDAALLGSVAVAVLRPAESETLTYAFVDLSALAAESMDAAAYDKTVIEELRPLPVIDGVAAEIKETYGVTVIGDVDFFDLSVFGYTAVPGTEDQIVDRLDNIKNVLDFFPTGIFMEIGQKTPVVIVLCKELGNAAGGINTILDGYAVSYVSVTGNDAFFENVTAHELAHAVERQMAQDLLDGWVLMQPAEAQAAYGNLYLTVEYTADDKGRTPVWFIDTYGRTSSVEDRATVFAAMYDAYAENDNSALNYDGLKQKVAYWSHMLRETYACCADAAFVWDGLFA